MAFTVDSEWRRRIIEQLYEAMNRQNFERMGWNARTWANPPWSGQAATDPSRGPVFAALEERLRYKQGVAGAQGVHGAFFGGRRSPDWRELRQAYDTSAEVRAFFAEADRRLLQRREEAAVEARRQREEAERERARDAVPGVEREAIAWVKAQAKLSEVTEQEWLAPWGVAENPAWEKTAAKLGALRPRPAPPVGGPFVMGFDPGDGRGDRAAYVFGHFVNGAFYLDYTGIVGDGL